eukprot:15460406-Alexandrium_andersonii.AAC.1
MVCCGAGVQRVQCFSLWTPVLKQVLDGRDVLRHGVLRGMLRVAVTGRDLLLNSCLGHWFEQ